MQQEIIAIINEIEDTKTLTFILTYLRKLKEIKKKA